MLSFFCHGYSMLFPLYPSVGCVSARDIPRWSVPISQGLCQRFELEGDDGVLARRVLGGIWTVFFVGRLVIYQPDGFDDVWCFFFPDVGCSSVVYMFFSMICRPLATPEDVTEATEIYVEGLRRPAFRCGCLDTWPPNYVWGWFIMQIIYIYIICIYIL